MKTYDVVKKILERNESARNSDKWLMWLVWEHQGVAGITMVKTSFIGKAISPESIRRARQKIQGVHPYLKPTSKRVRDFRERKKNTKGTFIYREDQERLL